MIYKKYFLKIIYQLNSGFRLKILEAIDDEIENNEIQRRRIESLGDRQGNEHEMEEGVDLISFKQLEIIRDSYL